MGKITKRTNKFSYKKIIWLLAISETLHNLEEAILFPSWINNSEVYHPQVSAFEFRFTIILLTLLIYWIIYFFSKHDNAFAKYLMAGTLVGILFNVFIPHLIGTIITARFVPGVITGVLLNIPVCLYLIWRGLKEGAFNLNSLIIGSLIFTVIALPLLQGSFAMGRLIEGIFFKIIN